MKRLLLVLLPATVALSFAAGAAWENHRAAADLESHIYREADARKSTGDWGSIRIYTPDTTTTHGTDSMLTAELEFLPGKRLQPPHQHEQEEFQYVIEGTGTWFLNGQETPIKPGDPCMRNPGTCTASPTPATSRSAFSFSSGRAKASKNPLHPDVVQNLDLPPARMLTLPA